MEAVPRPEPGSLQLALMVVVVGAFVVGCLTVGGGCLTVVQALWGSLGESTQIVSASVWVR